MDWNNGGPLEQAYVRFENLRTRLKILIDENKVTFQTFFALMEDYNKEAEEVRRLLRTQDYDHLGDFRKTTSTKRRVDARALQLLAPESKNLPGLYAVELKLNKAVLEGYLAEGRLDFALVEAATVIEEGTTRVYGPKSIKLNELLSMEDTDE